MTTTLVHLLRHGEVHNPERVLYGRLPGYNLSDLGRRMAEKVAEHLKSEGHDVVLVVASPLERAQQTAKPIADAYDLPIETDERLVEAANHFEGLRFGVGDGSLRHPRHWWYLRNPRTPSWGEPYREIATRMRAAADDAAAKAQGHEAVLVTHQLPVWITRLAYENRRFTHDPRRRECSLASLTTLTYSGDRLVGVTYNEPAADLLPGANRVPGA